MAALLFLSIGNFTRLAGNEHIRLIQFVSIFIIGVLAALLLNEFVRLFRAKRI